MFFNSISNPVPPGDNVEFGRNTMCHFLSSFFRSLTRGLILLIELICSMFSFCSN